MKDLFVGIDLGTTNSVVSYGNILPNGSIKCNIIETDRKSENGSKVREKTLPSVVFYSKDASGKIVPVVGDYAKSRYGTRYGYVCKSVKSLMGMQDNAGLNDEIPDSTPAQVSAQILKHLLNYTKTSLFQSESIEDVIITIPASFDSDQCQATLEAAKIAGVNIDNDHDVLLYEPKAVIYDFVHMQELGEISEVLIDLSSPKNILVFDLGGGTLDVTLHNVAYNKDGLMSIKDIAISRYTQIGGDNFDELIAEDMLSRFENKINLKISNNRKDEVMCKLRKIAEQAKIELNEKYDNAKNMGEFLDDDYEIEVSEINLYDAYSYSDYYTKKEIENIISKLLGINLTINDVSSIDRLASRDINNIIYPILDVLAKAGENSRVDAIIMNGGMTKFYPIKLRVDNFLSLNSICQNDPDLAVARGAVYYHYCLHKYNVKKVVISTEQIVTTPLLETESSFDVSTILNDTINLGIKGEYIIKLVEAGTKLPYVSEEIRDELSFGCETNTLALEIFLGRGKDKNLPNRRIAIRIVKFDKTYKTGTSISLKISIDSLRIINISVWITDSPNESAHITIENSKDGRYDKSLNIARLEHAKPIEMNAKSEIKILRTLSENTDWSSKKNANKEQISKINMQLTRIFNASNANEFFAVIIEEIKSSNNSNPYKGYMYQLADNFYGKWNEKQRKEIMTLCKQHFSEMMSLLYQENYILKHAFIYIYLHDEGYDEFARKNLSHYTFRFPAKQAIELLLSKPKIGIVKSMHLLSLCEEFNLPSDKQ